MLQFNFDATKETPASIAQKRALVAQLMTGGRAPQNVGEGFSAIGDGIVANVIGRRADEAQAAGDASAAPIKQRLIAAITGQGGAPTPSYDVASIGPQTASDATAAMAGVPSGDTAGYIRSGLISRGLPEHVADAFLLNFQDESGLNPGINEAKPLVPGSRGGYGLYQLTGPRRVAYENYARERGVDASDIDAQLDFMMSELQGPEAAAAQKILAAQDTGTAAAAIVNDFLRPAEEHRARRANAYTGGSYTPVQVAQGPDMAALMEAASNPFIMADPGMASVVNSLLQQQMQMRDPAYLQGLRAGDLGIQKAELELEALRNPAAPKPIEVGGVLLDPTTFEPIFDSRSDTGFTLSPGQQRFDAQGNPIAAVEAAPDITPLMQNLAAAGLEPGSPEYAQAIIDSVTKPQTQVSIGGEKSYDQTVGKGFGERYLKLQDDAASARSALNSLEVMQQAMQQPGFYSGFGAEQLAIAKRIGAAMGLDAEGIDSMEAFNAQAKAAALDSMGGSLGTGFSNADRDFVLDQVPTLGNTPQGNQTLIQIQRAINNRKVDIARLAREYAGRNGGRIDAGFDDYVADWAEQNPLFAPGSIFGGGAPAPQSTVDPNDIEALLELYK